MKIPKRIVATVLVGCSLSCVAVTSEFASKGSSGPRDFWDKKTWNKGLLPEDGNQVQMASYAQELTLNFSRDVNLAMHILEIKCGNAQAASGDGNRLFFNGDGRVFGTPDAESAYGNIPVRFVVYRNDNGTDARFLQNARDAADLSRGTYRWTNPVFTLDGFEDYSARLTFLKGDFNFYDPNGTTLNSPLTFGDNQAINATTVFSPGVSLKASKIVLSQADAAQGKDALVFDGATLEVSGALEMLSGAALALTNGAAAKLGNLSQKGGSALVSGVATTMTVTNRHTQTDGTFVVSDGATVRTKNAEIYGKAQMLLSEGAYTCSGSASIGVGSADVARIRVTGGNHRFEDGDTYLGKGCNAEILVEGGSLYAPRFRMGSVAKPTNTAVLRQTGGTLLTSKKEDRILSGILLCFADFPCEVRLEGGETRCSRLRYRYNPEDSGYSADVSAKATFVGNGGTLVPLVASSADSPFMGYLGSATIGSRGLALDNRQNLDTYIRQDFANVADEQGELRVMGGGMVSYEGVNTVAKTVLSGGTLRLATAATAFETDLTVAKGATFSMEGAATSVALDALNVDGGTIRLDPGDVITVRGNVWASGLVVDWTSAPTDPAKFLVVEGEMDEVTEQAIQGAISRAVIGANQHIGIGIVREGGTVAFTAQVKDNTPIDESGNVIWRGSSAAWSGQGNWDPAAPTAENRAVFGSAAQKSVALDADAAVGALRFTEGDYVIGGAKSLSVAGGLGAAEIAVLAGASKIGLPLKLLGPTALPIAPGASLELAGSVRGGGFVKSGKGALTLRGANRFMSDFEGMGGAVKVSDAAALACGSVARTHLTGGTLTFFPAGAEPLKLVDTPLVVESAEDAEAVIFNVERDVELDDFTMAGGAFFKRGVGMMTVNVPSGKPLTLTGMRTTPNQDISGSGAAGPWMFPADGSAPTGVVLKSGFNVVEGVVSLRGLGAGAAMTVDAMLLVGGPSHVCEAQPQLVVSNLSVTVAGTSDGGLWSGSGIGNTAYNQVTGAKIRLQDGAVLKSENAEVQPGYGMGAGGTFTYVATGGSTLDVAASYLVRTPPGSGAVEYVFTNSNFLVASTVQVNGGVRGDFHNSLFGANRDFAAVTLAFTEANRPRGELSFHDGSVFCCATLNEKDATIITSPLTFAFDDAEWRPSRANNADWTLAPPLSPYLVYEMRGKGVVFAPSTGVTYTIAAPLTGDGGLVVRGAGTVKLSAGAYAFSGVCRVEEGAIDLSAAGTLSNAKFGGAGTVKGATVNRCTLSLMAEDDWTVSATPTFDGCSLNGTLRVDFGRDETCPLDEGKIPDWITIGAWTGAGRKPSSVKVIGTGGFDLIGEIAFDADGTMRCKARRAGFKCILR